MANVYHLLEITLASTSHRSGGKFLRIGSNPSDSIRRNELFRTVCNQVVGTNVLQRAAIAEDLSQ